MISSALMVVIAVLVILLTREKIAIGAEVVARQFRIDRETASAPSRSEISVVRVLSRYVIPSVMTSLVGVAWTTERFSDPITVVGIERKKKERIARLHGEQKDGI